MKRTGVVTLCFLFVVGICAISNQSVNAQEYAIITINPDGSITPSSAPIQQSGDTYTLTNEVIGNIKVNKSDCVLDGKGHTITFSGSGPGTPITISVNDVANVTIKNFIINTGWFGIAIYGSHCLIDNNTITNTGNGIYEIDSSTSAIKVAGDYNVISGNYLTNNFNGLWFYQAKNNTVIGNTIKDTGGSTGRTVNSAISFFEASNNTIYHNNFENNSINYTVQVYNSGSCINVWDNGYPDGGNYWSDYQMKYPNATMIDNSGIGNTPYFIDDQNKDSYPLMEPFNATLPVETSPTPSSPTGGGSEDAAVDFTVLGMVAVVIVVVLVIAGLAVHYGRRRR
jgi:parallel beta-helix repeat protein